MRQYRSWESCQYHCGETWCHGVSIKALKPVRGD